MFTALAFFSDVSVFFLGLKTTITDPSDLTVREERYCRMTKQHFDDNLYEFYCNHCDTNVRAFSKHCGRCKRCTAQFDHHCIWLNNCIGYNNYRPFFCLLIMVIFHSLVNVGLGVWRFLYFHNLNFDYLSAPLIIVYIMVFINVVAIILIGYLLAYHIWLYFKGMTTYQHIMEQRKQKQEKDNQRYLNQQSKKDKRKNKLGNKKKRISICKPSQGNEV